MIKPWESTVLGVFITWIRCKVLVWLCPPWAQFLLGLHDHGVQMWNVDFLCTRHSGSIGWRVVLAALYTIFSITLFTQISLWHHAILLEALTGFLLRFGASGLYYIQLDESLAEEDLHSWLQNRNSFVAYLVSWYAFSDLYRSWRLVMSVSLYAGLPGAVVGVVWFRRCFVASRFNYSWLLPALAVAGQLADWCDFMEEFVVFHLPRHMQRLLHCVEKRVSSRKPLPLYEYHPLGQNEIRLLVFGNAKWPFTSMPDCGMIECRLDAAERFGYEAISYQWGSSDRVEDILIDGLRFPVTKSAFEVLSARSSIFRSRLIWIDAICIDQGNEVEKANQVQMMTKIYFKAKRVIVCPTDVWRPRLVAWTFNTFKQVPSNMDPESEWTIDHVRASRGAIMPPRWRALTKFIENDYFTRAWIVQEIAAGCVVHIYIGGLYVSWSNLYGLCNQLGKRPIDLWQMSQVALFTGGPRGDLHSMGKFQMQKPENRVVNIQIIAALRGDFDLRVTDAVPISLERTLLETQGFHATDPRDYVFSMTGMARYDPRTAALQPDYRCPLSEIYEQTAKVLFLHQEHPSIDLLALAGVGFAGKSVPLRSWVPDFGRGREPQPLTVSMYESGKYCAAEGTRVSIRQGAIVGSIEVQGLICDVVECLSSAGPLTIWNEDQENELEALRSIHNHSTFLKASFDLIDGWSGLTKKPREDLAAQLRNQLWRTVLGDRMHWLHDVAHDGAEVFDAFFQNVNGLADKKTFNEYTEYFAFDCSEKIKTLHHDGSIVRFCQGYLSTCQARCFGISKSGRACIVPAKSSVGDIIFVPHGSQVPYLIRKYPIALWGDSEPVELYELVGECYVQGLMNGEAVSNRSSKKEWITIV